MLINLLKLADDFELDHLKELMELRLLRLVNRTNVKDMKGFAETSKAHQLENYCYHFILENIGLGGLDIDNKELGKVLA